MDFTWAISVLSFLSGGAGAYLGSYLRKKGENLATHEDMDRLVDQVRAVTTATKEIETKISSDLWDRQKQWEVKRDIQFDAAKNISRIENALLTLHTGWSAKLKRGSDESSRVGFELECVTAWEEAIHPFQEMESLILLTCSAETMYAFTELGDLLRETAAAITRGKIEAYPETKDQRDDKFTAARGAIRRELGFPFNLGDQTRAQSMH